MMIPSSSFSLTNIPNHHHYTLPSNFFIITNIIIIIFFHHTFVHDHYQNHSKLAQEQAQEEDLNQEDKPYFHQLDYI
ncbi:unnamed protein product [Trifolium pratense]|uniref:Uncharacterized protein n=1 Tax=Trifolium pratense TaxID=57577 RepID=A0ACB0L4T4_TRIPR|nr:unnamed protein product [Trifolium pratense]